MQPRSHIAIFLLFFCAGWPFLTSFVWSQAEAVVKGKVVNEKGEPVKNASAKLGSRDARTNSSGLFFVRSSGFPAQLTINHPSYSEYVDLVVLHDGWKDTIEVLIAMGPKAQELEGVTVTAEQISWVYRRKQASILDFILQPDDGILLCCRDENSYFARGVNIDGDKLFEASIRSHPKILFRDCMENVHLVYADSIYQTLVIGNSFNTYPAQPVPGLFSLLQSCVYKDPQTLVRYHYTDLDQHVEYEAIDIPTKTSKILYVAEDRAKVKQLVTYIGENQLDETMLMSSDEATLAIAKMRWDNKRFFEQVLSKPLYVPMFELNDSLVIFDHLNDSAIVLTKGGQRVRAFPIFYHYFDGWKKELIPNMEKTRIFARYESPEGLTLLREVNLSNGKTDRVIKLEKHIFPQHLQVKGEFVYYLYKDRLDKSMQYIYKQRLQ